MKFLGELHEFSLKYIDKTIRNLVEKQKREGNGLFKEVRCIILGEIFDYLNALSNTFISVIQCYLYDGFMIWNSIKKFQCRDYK